MATEDPNVAGAPHCNAASPRSPARHDGSVGAIQHGAQNIINSTENLDQDGSASAGSPREGGTKFDQSTLLALLNC